MNIFIAKPVLSNGMTAIFVWKGFLMMRKGEERGMSINIKKICNFNCN